jgi:hypothetical protein
MHYGSDLVTFCFAEKRQWKKITMIQISVVPVAKGNTIGVKRKGRTLSFGGPHRSLREESELRGK